MAALLVTYDLNKETTRPPIVQAIKEYPRWAKLSESSYAIVTDASPQAVYNGLHRHLDSNDQLYVINLRKPYAGQGSKEVNDWLENNLSY
jgi:hypothetical protein